MKIINLLTIISFVFLTGAMENPPKYNDRNEPGCPYAPWMSDGDHTQFAEELTNTESLSSWAIKSLLQDSYGLEKIERALKAVLINTEVEDMLLHALVKSHKLSLLQFFWSELNSTSDQGIALPYRGFSLPNLIQHQMRSSGAANGDLTIAARVENTKLTILKTDLNTLQVQPEIFENVFSEDDVLLAAKITDNRLLNCLVAPRDQNTDGRFGRGVCFLQFDFLQKRVTLRKELFTRQERTYVIKTILNKANTYALFVLYSTETHASSLVICSLKTGEMKELPVKSSSLVLSKGYMLNPKTGVIEPVDLEDFIAEMGDFFCSKIEFNDSGDTILIAGQDKRYSHNLNISSYVCQNYKLADIVCILQQMRDNPA